MDIHPIQTEADYKAALRQISTLMVSDPALGKPEGDRLNILATLVQAYETRHVPIGAPDPVEASMPLTRVVNEQAFPLALKVPNALTRAAMEEARVMAKARTR